MKLLFICTSLEPGRDGVGDYTRILAGECARAGHECRLLAVNDAHLSGHAPLETSPALRLPAIMPWHERATVALAWAQAFAPDWQSWQIVPYGFHDKGVIPREACKFAATLAQGGSWRRHVMLHELWLGLSAHESARNRITGALQRRALKKFLLALHPDALDTTNPTYLAALVRNDIAASHIPIFGNIPVIAPPAAVARAAGVFNGVIFGTVHPQFLPVARRAMAALLAGARASGGSLRITIVGNTGAHGLGLVESLQNFAPDGQFEIRSLGEMPAEKVSLALQEADFGIAMHPWALLGKSGVVAAMLDHGLPVFVPRDEWALRGHAIKPFSGYWPYSSGLVERLDNMPPEHLAGWLARRRAPARRAPEVAAQFLERLNTAATA